jgi:alpha-ketoglutarate-dependent taurine dioxygenase
MSIEPTSGPPVFKPGAFKRRAVSVTSDSMVKIEPLFENGRLPLLVEPRMAGLNLDLWAADNRALIEEKLQLHGGILFRSFHVESPDDLESFIRAVSGEALEYRERSSPRSQAGGNIYTSTDYPPSQPIFLHNENSYQSVWPLKIFFCCNTPSPVGGETPIADCRRIFERIAPEIRERFAAKGWMYVRNFGDGFGLTWQTVFQATDKAQVEEHCRKAGIEIDWKAGDRLRTRAVRPALARHPKTGEALWFNHVAIFHVTTLDQAVQKVMLDEFQEEDLPANSYYGDGSSIEPEVLDHIRQAYSQETVSFPWQKGDLLMLDNMLVAHGRAPFSGERRILVGMAEPVRRDLLPPFAG